ncbi:MAG TPA: protein kinase [Chthoniobacterales bacterium]|jgi:serine/threonine protein kinase|nr:protein kinase [Chthoniobacterales bacterium]
MLREDILREIREAKLNETVVTVSYKNGAAQQFTLGTAAGPGSTSVTFNAIDTFGRQHAIKFVPQDYYKHHTIEAELLRVRRLTRRFSQITWYGEPAFEKTFAKNGEMKLYAIVTDWIDGPSFASFAAQEGERLEVPEFLEIARDLCEMLALLKEHELVHNDLHAENLIVTTEATGPRLQPQRVLRVIDTGSLKTIERHQSILDSWRTEVATLQQLKQDNGDNIGARIAQLEDWISWFSRTDQEWVVYHLCALISRMRRRDDRLPLNQRRFLQDITPVLSRMLDPDPHMRLSDPAQMFDEIELLWKKVNTPASSAMMGPFDLISAELIRSDDQLNALFSEKAPWLAKCSTTDPVYIYGPRGCGKSTVLRRISLPAVLATSDAAEQFAKMPYIGVYMSCSSELRSRFWLFPKQEYDQIEGDVVLFFTMLLVEALLDTLELLRDGNCELRLGHTVGLTNDAARAIAEKVFEHFSIPGIDLKLGGVSWLTFARKELSLHRQIVWRRILTNPSRTTPNPSLLFELCKSIEEALPLLKQKHIAFLLDDYSNQRIPAELQRRLNQTISFAKQGNPIFKVSSEYFGVDLDGIQEGREVVEVNFGWEYVELNDAERGAFLEDVLDIRFKRTDVDTTVDALLGRSGLNPGLPLARAIRKCHEDGKPFYYYGIDTVADICSGDVAMALDLVKQIYMTVDAFPPKQAVSAAQQHAIIHRYADREHMYVRYFAKHGKAMSEVVGALCWLAHQCACEKTSMKTGTPEPMIKTHLDIALQAVAQLPEDCRELLLEMEKRGVLFSLDTSRSRIHKEGTERYQVRRILLAKTVTPLGRKDAIKLDHVHKLQFLLQEPHSFVREEFDKQARLRLKYARD